MGTDEVIDTNDGPASAEPVCEPTVPGFRFAAAGSMALTGSTVAVTGSVEVGVPRALAVLAALVIAALAIYLIVRSAVPVAARVSAATAPSCFLPVF
jgi:hypothetical protein